VSSGRTTNERERVAWPGQEKEMERQVQLWPCLGPRPRRLNAKRGNNPAKQVASDARLRNAPEAKSGSFNCARKNRRSDVPAVLAFTRRASGARGPKQGLS